MTSGTFEMDSYMPDLMDDFDFGAFLNLPPDDADQGGEDGQGGSIRAKLMPEACDEQRTDVAGPSYISALLGSSGNSEARQSTDNQPCTKNVSPKIDLGADNFYGDATAASGYSRPEYPTVLRTAGSETIATKNCGEACIVAPTQEPSWSPPPDLPYDSSSQKDCTCISCLGIGKFSSRIWRVGCRFPNCQNSIKGGLVSGFFKHEKGHYGQTGKYICLEQTCQVATKNFGDLKRHDKAKHYTNPQKEQFPCPVLWCKYSGNNGFARKDKLKSHYKNIHEGKPGPVKAGRVIKLATLKPQVSGLLKAAPARRKSERIGCCCGKWETGRMQALTGDAASAPVV